MSEEELRQEAVRRRLAGESPSDIASELGRSTRWVRKWVVRYENLTSSQKADEVVEGLVHHSDAGSQYTAIRYSNRLADVGALASIGTIGDSFDNARWQSQ